MKLHPFSVKRLLVGSAGVLILVFVLAGLQICQEMGHFEEQIGQSESAMTTLLAL